MIGQRIREFRKSKGLTVREFANKCNLSYTNLSNIENGKVKPSKSTFSKIASAYDLDKEFIANLIIEGYLEKETDTILDLVAIINKNYCLKKENEYLSSEFYEDVRSLLIAVVSERINYYSNKNKKGE